MFEFLLQFYRCVDTVECMKPIFVSFKMFCLTVFFVERRTDFYMLKVCFKIPYPKFWLRFIIFFFFRESVWSSWKTLVWIIFKTSFNLSSVDMVRASVVVEIQDRLSAAEFTFLLVANMVFRRAVVFLPTVFTLMSNDFILFTVVVAA